MPLKPTLSHRHAAPTVSLKVTGLPLSYTPRSLGSFVRESFPGSHVEVPALVTEYANDGKTPSSLCGTFAVKIKPSKLKKHDDVAELIIGKLHTRKVYDARGKPWRPSFDKTFIGIVPLYEHADGADIE